MKLIVGLGNPGEKYAKTRHNLGFMVVEAFLKNHTKVKDTAWENNKKFKSDLYQFEFADEKIILAKPKTFMNNSGMAVSLIAKFYKIKPEDVWIINDELDIPLGGLKIRFGGGAGGHKGVESIIDSIKTDKFWRFRLGIGEQKGEMQVNDHGVTNDFVLGNFSRNEKSKIKDTIKRTVKALEKALEKDLVSAQNQYNTK